MQSSPRCLKILPSQSRRHRHWLNIANVKVVVAPTVCGPFVVVSTEIVDDINEMDRNLMALDMEGFGLYAACQAMAVECLWVKGVADYGKPGKGNAYHKLASYASAMFIYKLIKESL